MKTFVIVILIYLVCKTVIVGSKFHFNEVSDYPRKEEFSLDQDVVSFAVNLALTFWAAWLAF